MSAPVPALRAEMKRKLLHVAMGSFALALAWLTWWQAAILAGGAALFNWLLLPRVGGRGLWRAADAERGYATGILLYPLAVLGLVLVFRDRLWLAAAAWGILAAGDGFATITGVLYGRRRLPWNAGKSWVGSATYVVLGTLAATVLWMHVAGDAEPGWRFPFFACLAAALVGALFESLPVGLDDNLVTPVVTGLVLWCAELSRGAAERLAYDPELGSRALTALAVNGAIAAAALALRLITPGGVAAAFVIGAVTWTFGGPAAFALLMAFFLAGTAATKLGFRRKKERGLAQENEGKRGARHAWANCGVATACALLVAISRAPIAFAVALAAAYATALADTLGSEVGQLYGRRAFLVTTLREVPPGTDGAVSLPGTLAGCGGAAAIGTLGAALGLYGWREAAIVTVAGIVGTTLESVLGATIETMRLVDNEFMNFTNTLIGAATAALLLAVLR